MKPNFWTAAIAATISLAGVPVSCTGQFSSCETSASCAENGGSGGARAGSGGQTTSGAFADDDGGVSGNGPSSGTAGRRGGSKGGGTGLAGEGGTSECDDECSDVTPVCDGASNTCVECAKSSDCKSTSKPACDTTSNTCVACLGNANCKDTPKPFCDKSAAQCVACLKAADCTDAKASVCSAGACTACTVDADCSSVVGKGVCDSGTCVQCTVAQEGACGVTSCNPTTKECTATPVGSVNYCEPCVADSECIGGNQAAPDARCIPMKFAGISRPGGFCLRRVAMSCTPPYGVPNAGGSLSGAPSELYCGIDQTATRCEAILDLVSSRPCADGLAPSCGCARNKAGICIESGQGGLCKPVGAFMNRCTIPCASTDQCPTTLTCPGGAKPYCQ